ncbi:uncharacterized protein LOC125045589 [Penaeus chinensis]|uniref:uncharacterized protein LOC125045589 n=1 Tax=Penaeus chinensis TaxID=139456 RepID=UPI001FB6971E|nr:uncharacterized protein LOC125045589 [Penaeus chinensis]XP_047498900.1 uncharacterized protein LOC125045589 [Penaeus chinensis]
MTSDFQTAVTCSLCWELFAAGIQDPLILPKCGHTFCRQCLCKLESKGTWHCPLCRCPYRGTSISELPVNFVALSVISTLKRSDRKIQAKSKGSTGHFTSSLNGKQTPLRNSAALSSPNRKSNKLLLRRAEAPERLQFSLMFISGLSFEEQRYKEQTKRDSSSIVNKSAFTSPNAGRFLFAKDDTSGSASSSASASALSLFRFGQAKSTLGNVSPTSCGRDKVTLARPESSVTKNAFDQPPCFELPINNPTVSSGQSNGCVWHTEYLFKGFTFASDLTPSAPKADPRDRSQIPELLKCNEPNSASRSLPNDINISSIVNDLRLLTISKTSTTESSGMHNLSSVVKESNTEIVLTQNRSSPLKIPITNMVSTNETFSKASTPGESFNFGISHLDLPLTITTSLQMLRSDVNYFQKILSKEFGLTNASASDSSAPTNSPSLETSTPRHTSTSNDSSSKTAAANNPISFTDLKKNNHLKVIPMNQNNSNAHSFRFTHMDPRKAILTTFQKLNSETGYYEEITSKGFLGKEPSAHRFRRTLRMHWRRHGKCQESKSAQKNQDLQCQSSSTSFRGLGARPKSFTLKKKL